jgi:hypothetical protein
MIPNGLDVQYRRGHCCVGVVSSVDRLNEWLALVKQEIVQHLERLLADKLDSRVRHIACLCFAARPATQIVVSLTPMPPMSA